MLRAKPFDGPISQPMQAAADATQTNCPANNDASVDPVIAGLAITGSCFIISLGLAYARFVYTGVWVDGVVVFSMSFLPLRALFWFLFKH